MIHRFYLGNIKDKTGLLQPREHVWVNDPSMVNQVLRVLRMRRGEELVLFDGKGTERLYKIDEIEASAFHLQRITDIEPKYPKRKVILAFSLLKKDKNDWVLQKATELGVTHILPIISDRTEKSGFDIERAQKIIIEAAEQCGRHSIPVVNEPQGLAAVVGEYSKNLPICVADMTGEVYRDNGSEEILVLVGPEGGWSEKERELFVEKNLPHIALGEFTLRAETACIAAVQLLGS